MARRGKENISENMIAHLTKLQEQMPEMLSKPFQFSQKEDHINWHQLEELDIGQMQKTPDLHLLEKVLSNATYSKLRKEDIDRIGDPAVIKLFKLSQLTMEYMQFNQGLMENLIEGIDVKYRHSFEKCRAMENKVLTQQLEINRIRNEMEVK